MAHPVYSAVDRQKYAVITNEQPIELLVCYDSRAVTTWLCCDIYEYIRVRQNAKEHIMAMTLIVRWNDM